MEKSNLKWEDLEKNARYEPLEEELEETRKQKRSKIKMEKQESKNIEKIINLQEINRKNKEEQEKIRLKTEIANLKKQEKKKQICFLNKFLLIIFTSTFIINPNITIISYY